MCFEDDTKLFRSFQGFYRSCDRLFITSAHFRLQNGPSAGKWLALSLVTLRWLFSWIKLMQLWISMSKHIRSHFEFEQNGELKRISLRIIGMLWLMNGIWCFITVRLESSSSVEIRNGNWRISRCPSRTAWWRSDGKRLQLKSIIDKWSLVIVHGSDLSLLWLKFSSFRVCACFIEKGNLVISLELRSIWVIAEHFSRLDEMNAKTLFDMLICDKLLRILSPSSQLQSIVPLLSPILFPLKFNENSFSLPRAFGSFVMAFWERSSVVRLVRLRIPIGIWDKLISRMFSSLSVRGNPLVGNSALLLIVSFVTCSSTALLLWLNTRRRELSLVFSALFCGQSWSFRKLRKAFSWIGSDVTRRSISGTLKQSVHLPASTNLLRTFVRFPVISVSGILEKIAGKDGH